VNYFFFIQLLYHNDNNTTFKINKSGKLYKIKIDII